MKELSKLVPCRFCGVVVSASYLVELAVCDNCLSEIGYWGNMQ